MIRAFVLYADEPSPERYAEHVEFCLRVAGATFRHGPIFGAAVGDPKYRYYAEFEFPDRESFTAATGSPEFKAIAADATAMGIPHEVYFADVD